MYILRFNVMGDVDDHHIGIDGKNDPLHDAGVWVM